MRALGHVALSALSTLAFAVALIPPACVLMLGAPDLTRLCAEPAIGRAALASLQAACIVFAVGWPAGVLAALGIWGAPAAARRLVLGAALLALLIAIALPSAAGAGALILPAASSACVVLLVLTGALNRIDPGLLQTGAAIGASPFRAWLAILAAIRPTLILSAAASVSLGLALCTGMPGQPALAGLLRQAIGRAQVEAAPEALLLALLSLPPLLLACLLLPGSGFRRA